MGNIFRGRNMEMEYLRGLMVPLMMVNSSKIISKALESIIGLMAENTQALG